MDQLPVHFDLLARYVADVEESPIEEGTFTLTERLKYLEPLFRRGDLDRELCVRIMCDAGTRVGLSDVDIKSAIESAAPDGQVPTHFEQAMGSLAHAITALLRHERNGETTFGNRIHAAEVIQRLALEVVTDRSLAKTGDP